MKVPLGGSQGALERDFPTSLECVSQQGLCHWGTPGIPAALPMLASRDQSLRPNALETGTLASKISIVLDGSHVTCPGRWPASI